MQDLTWLNLVLGICSVVQVAVSILCAAFNITFITSYKHFHKCWQASSQSESFPFLTCKSLQIRCNWISLIPSKILNRFKPGNGIDFSAMFQDFTDLTLVQKEYQIHLRRTHNYSTLVMYRSWIFVREQSEQEIL